MHRPTRARSLLRLPLLLTWALLAACSATPAPATRSEAAPAPPEATAMRAAPEPAALAAAAPSEVQPAPSVRRFAIEAAEPSAERLRADVAWLADDAREGRRAGTEGERAAARFLAERFEALGLEPAGEDGYFQSFGVPLPARVGAGSAVKWIGLDQDGVGSGQAQAEPLFCSASGSARGPLAYAGYGIVYDERGWDDYAELDVQGKVVAILRGAPADEGLPEPEGGAAGENPHGVPANSGWGATATVFHKVMEAKRRGAVAVVLLPRTPDEALLSFDVGRSGESGIPAVTIPWEVFERLRGADEVEVTAEVLREHGQATNVLARLPGANHSAVLLLGAHYDHLGHGGLGSLAPDEAGAIHNGADDNASGTAVVLEVARCLAEGATPPCDVVFALWSGEELGLLGSEHWASFPTLPLADVLFNLNLDMVGRAGGGKLQVLGAGTAEPFGDWLRAAAVPAGLDLAINASGQGVGGSDHQTFLKRMVPALHFFSGVHTDYHRPSDDVERFEAEGAAHVARLALEVLACAMQLAADEAPLAWVAPPASDEPQTTGGFRTRFGSVPEYSYEGPGVLLAGTSPGGPAERGGLVKDDIVQAIGDIEIGTIHDLMFALNAHKPGDVVLVRYLREGEPREVRLTLDAPGLE